MVGELMDETITINGTDPCSMTGEERLADVSMLLSLAMMRLWMKRRAGARPTARE